MSLSLEFQKKPWHLLDLVQPVTCHLFFFPELIWPWARSIRPGVPGEPGLWPAMLRREGARGWRGGQVGNVSLSFCFYRYGWICSQAPSGMTWKAEATMLRDSEVEKHFLSFLSSFGHGPIFFFFGFISVPLSSPSFKLVSLESCVGFCSILTAQLTSW